MALASGAIAPANMAGLKLLLAALAGMLLQASINDGANALCTSLSSSAIENYPRAIGSFSGSQSLAGGALLAGQAQRMMIIFSAARAEPNTGRHSCAELRAR